MAPCPISCISRRFRSSCTSLKRRRRSRSSICAPRARAKRGPAATPVARHARMSLRPHVTGQLPAPKRAPSAHLVLLLAVLRQALKRVHPPLLAARLAASRSSALAAPLLLLLLLLLRLPALALGIAVLAAAALLALAGRPSLLLLLLLVVGLLGAAAAAAAGVGLALDGEAAGVGAGEAVQHAHHAVEALRARCAVRRGRQGRAAGVEALPGGREGVEHLRAVGASRAARAP